MKRVNNISISFNTICAGFLFLVALVSSVFSQTHGDKSAETISTLEFGQTVEREISGGQRHSFKIRLSAGQFIKVQVEQNNCDILLSFQNSDKINVFEFKDENFRNGLESQVAAVETNGEYELRLSSFEPASQKGTYKLKIAELRQATEKELSFSAGIRILAETFAKENPGNSTADVVRRSIGKLEIVLEKFRQAESFYYQSTVFNNIAALYNRLGDYQNAIKHQLLAAETSNRIGGADNHVTILSSLSVYYLNLGEPQKALDTLFEALNWKGEASGVDKARTLNSIGLVYERLGSPEKAKSYYEQSFEQAKDLADKRYLAIAQNSLGKANYLLGNYQKAADYFQNSVEISRGIKNKRLEASTLGNLAQAFFALGNTEKATEFLNEALIINRALTDKVTEAAILRKIGHIALSSGQTDVALENFIKAVEICRTTEDKEILGIMLLSLAKAEAKNGNLKSAQNKTEEAISLIEKIRSRVQNTELRDSFSVNLKNFYGFYVEILMERDQVEPNKGFAELALQANERAHARGLLNLLSESNSKIRQGVDEKLLARETELRNLLTSRLENLTRVLSGKTTPEQINKLNAEIEQIRLDYDQTQSQIRQTSPRYASLTQPETLSVSDIQQKILDEDTVLLEYALGETKSFLWIVTKNSFQKVELPKNSEIEAKARPYFEALTARNKKIKFETAAEKQRRIEKADAELPMFAESLSQIILAPAQNLLTKKRLLIVADGILQYIPFASLTTKNKQPLVADHEIVSLPSASTLAVLRKEFGTRKPAPKSIAVIADPVFTESDERFRTLEAAKKRNNPNQIAVSAKTRGEANELNQAVDDFSDGESGYNFSRLPFTRKEAETISAFASATDKKLSLDFSANLSNATNPELANYRIVHFATHSFLNSRHPELSGIVLSLIDENGKPLNGFLRTDEIYNLNFPAELVVLSGCRTGLGKEIRGEGLIGLTRGFMYAGAKRVAVSLWDVNDEATAELMARFYKEMLDNKKLSPASALRAAQLSMSKDKRWSNPYYWAGFILQGEFK